jgi:hypothetical protein
VGRRSRRREAQGTTRAERDAARRERAERPPERRRPAGSERPPAPWGRFPLSELVIFIGILVIVWGLFSGEDGGNERIAAGLVLASLGGGELALREHLAGYRSHTTLLAGVAAFVAVTVTVLAAGSVKLWLLVLVGVLAFGGAFYAFRELFKRRSGGLGFR